MAETAGALGEPGVAKLVILPKVPIRRALLRVANMPNKQTLEDEKLLTRLASTWHTHRSGNPGFGWTNARSAYMSTSLWKELQDHSDWSSAASDRELMGAWLSVTAKHHWKPDLFDSWDEGSLASGRTTLQKAQNRKKAASVSRKATGKARQNHAGHFEVSDLTLGTFGVAKAWNVCVHCGVGGQLSSSNRSNFNWA